ncbi:hypothetical protein AWC15_00130 [Mycobacterium lacus]|nr:hypothetical protein AWC15_00130 [Mycobacterium lacus]
MVSGWERGDGICDHGTGDAGGCGRGFGRYWVADQCGGGSDDGSIGGGRRRGVGGHGRSAAALHDEFVCALAAGGESYAAAEAANASPLQELLDW